MAQQCVQSLKIFLLPSKFMVMCNVENPFDSITLLVATLTIIIFFLCKVDEAGVGKDCHRHQDQ
jgi:hypothetical protein